MESILLEVRYLPIDRFDIVVAKETDENGERGTDCQTRGLVCLVITINMKRPTLYQW